MENCERAKTQRGETERQIKGKRRGVEGVAVKGF